MENYIIRIYRRDRRNLRKITGMVESVETDMKRPFTDLDQLREIIALGNAANSRVMHARKKTNKQGGGP